MNSMDKFNKCAAEIFSLLYERFPLGTDIAISNFPEYENQENNEIFFSTIDFFR